MIFSPASTKKREHMSGNMSLELMASRAVLVVPSLSPPTPVRYCSPYNKSQQLIKALIVPIIQEANHIIVMEDCRVARQGPYSTMAGDKTLAQANISFGGEEPPLPETHVTDGASDAMKKKENEIKDQINNLLESQGDTSLYWYYMKSIGWKYTLTALFFATSMELFVIFRRKLFDFTPNIFLSFRTNPIYRTLAKIVDRIQHFSESCKRWRSLWCLLCVQCDGCHYYWI